MRNSQLILLLFFIVLISGFSVNAWSQSLGKDRVERLRHSVVQVLIDGEGAGTGFMVDEKLLITNWHVIKSALLVDSVKNTTSIFKKIIVKFSNGEIVPIEGVNSEMFNGGMLEAVIYDYCLLHLSKKPDQVTYPFKLSSLASINEGDRIITAGYPLFLKHQFISSGILSTKFIDTLKVEVQGKPVTFLKSAAWIDLTMSKGNSGGPIIKLGNTWQEDEVVGIATFIQSPFSERAIEFYEASKKSGWDIRSGNFSQTDANQLFALSAHFSSYGISGCIDIQHFQDFVKKLTRK